MARIGLSSQFLNLFTIVVYVVGAYEFSDYMEASRKLEAKNSLNFGDTCSVETEKLRKALGHKMRVTPGYLTKEIRELAGTGFNLCNFGKNLACGPSGTCVCANGFLMGMNVTTVFENGSCFWKSGTTCIPPSEKYADWKCQGPSQCEIQLGLGKWPCTQKRIGYGYVGSSVPLDELKIRKEIDGGLCKCT